MMHDDDLNELLVERVERRLSEECGRLQIEMADLRGEMRAGQSELRAEMVRGNTAMLKWLLVFFVSQTAALAAILRLFVN